MDQLSTPIRLRHPEKAHGPDNPSPPRPPWIRVQLTGDDAVKETRSVLKRHDLVTVCEEAACPNIGECWQKKHATFMILGSICTRACAFCNVATGRPGALDPLEPQRVAAAVGELGLAHVVITSVDRDDLDDGGAEHFAATIRSIRQSLPETTVEVLTPDFRGKGKAMATVMASPPDVFNHNLETVPRLYPSVRPGSRYFHSLRVLDEAKRLAPGVFTKSGIMVGLGETEDEVFQVMDDLRTADVDFLTIGQYLQPTPKHHGIDRFVTPDEFDAYKRRAEAKGFHLVSATPLTRSSYHADADFRELQDRRKREINRFSARPAITSN